MECNDHYCTLGIGRNASAVEIRTAYRRMAKRFHPDVTEDTDGERKFKAVGEAYKTLRSPEMRTAYNLQLESLQQIYAPFWANWISVPPDLSFALLPWPILTWLWWQ